MSILIYAESWEGKFKKSTYEAVSYGVELAKQMGTEAVALTINAESDEELGAYGVSKVLKVSDASFDGFSPNNYAAAIKAGMENAGANVVVLNTSSNVRSFAPALSYKANASMASGVSALPKSTSPFVVYKKVFSNKAAADVELKKDNKLLVLANNSFGLIENSVSATVESLDVKGEDSRIKVVSRDIASGKVNLMDAEVVVSAGRGLKGPENWTMIEELAEELNAATACSKPVSDIGWRPHSEHVGQTGKNISPNLYFAIGISGAIQHVAGINSSKVIVAVNTDDEAPIFKAADYGIVGDAFKVVPELIEKIKELKG